MIRCRPLGAIALAAAVLAACSGGDTDAGVSTVPATVATTAAVVATTAAPTTAAPTTLPPTTVPETTTTVPPVPTWPLTGLEATDLIAAARPAIAVKLDNHRAARPHAGLNQADIVYEEIVEAQITRFFAVFHSTETAPIGPIRSARTTDVALLDQLGRPLFAWSGGNRGVVEAVGRADAVSVAHGQRPDLYYRDAERRARTDLEHTLMARGTADFWANIQPGQRVPPPFFAYRAPGEVAVGDDMAGFGINMRSVRVAWRWDPAAGLWLRDEYGEPHLLIDGSQVSAHNVLVQFIEYGTSVVDARSPEGYTVGSGDGLLFSDGKVLLVRWERLDPSAPATFTAPDGSPVRLTPGRTWIELAEAGASQVAPL